MKIAIVGSGISGLTSAHLLFREHDITVFDNADRIGGHTATVDVDVDGEHFSIDTGFIVYNDWTYPNFIRLLNRLGVESQPTDMGFSVHCDQTNLQYSGASLATLFAQKRNLFRFSHWQMLRDIVRFNKHATEDLKQGRLASGITLGEYLAANGYSKSFQDNYLNPMGSAIWSATLDDISAFPLRFFVEFFHNHGLLSIKNRPQWRVLKGGSKSYLAPLIKGFEDKILLNTTISGVERTADSVNIYYRAKDGENKVDAFDQIVFACHSDQALNLLADADTTEKTILGALPYQNNEVVLHTDVSLLPSIKSVWSSWNYKLNSDVGTLPVLTYNMNILQRLSSDKTFCVTLNNSSTIDPAKVLGVYHYAHPRFSLDSITAQQRWHEINGVNRTWFCGAYWRNGFHEDGVVSAMRVAKYLVNGVEILSGSGADAFASNIRERQRA